MSDENERVLDDRSWLDLAGSTLDSVTANDYNVVLTFSGGAALTIEGRAKVAQGDQAAISFSCEEAISAREILRLLLSARVVSAAASKTGALRIVLDSDTSLHVPFDADYEAWQLNDAKGTWICLPGGGIATFPPNELGASSS